MKALEIEYRNEHLSVSRLRTYEQCAYAFFCRYVEKLTGEPVPAAMHAAGEGEAAGFGKILHAALEATFTWIIGEEYEGPFPEEQLVAAYKAAWQAEPEDERSRRDPKLVGAQLYTEGLRILRGYAQAHPAVNHFDILAVEQEFNIEVEGFKLNGFIDRVDRGESDDEITIIDFKSNRRTYTRDELAGDLQLSIYGLAARALYPWAKRVRFSFHMLRFAGLEQRTTRTAQDIDDAAGYIVALGRRSENDKEWRATLNENCAYCDHRRRCATYARALAGGHEVTKARLDDDLEKIAIEREQVANIAKAAYARKSELDVVIKRALADRSELHVAGRVYQFQHPNETVYERAATLRAFESAGVPHDEILARVLDVDPKAVEDLRVEVVARLDRADALLLNASLGSAARKVPMTSRLDSRASKTVALKAKARATNDDEKGAKA